MKIAIAGLGRMGSQIARKLSENSFEVLANNRSQPPIDEAVKFGAIAAPAKEDVIKGFGNEPVVLWLMIPAEAVDKELADWLEILPSNSIIIDGGNSNYTLTQKRSELVAGKGSRLIDVGTSGGIWGYQNGFSMMAGGDERAFKTIEPVLQTLAQPEGAYHYFGPSGNGHFVKMVHNAIEYGMMESLAEGYQMLKEGPYPKTELTAAAEVWQHHSVVTSWLNELCRDVLKENPELEGIEGIVAESGETRWTLEAAKQLNVPLPSIQSAYNVRVASQQGQTSFATKLLAAMRNKFGGHNLNTTSTKPLIK